MKKKNRTMVDVSERTYMMRFEIKRERHSVTQGAGMGLQGESRRRLQRLGCRRTEKRT